jgi:hypothetical protein
MSQPVYGYCPICGAALDEPQECALCRFARAPALPAGTSRPVAAAHRLPEATSMRHLHFHAPDSLRGIAPVAWLALAFAVLALVLLIVNLCLDALG